MSPNSAERARFNIGILQFLNDRRFSAALCDSAPRAPGATAQVSLGCRSISKQRGVFRAKKRSVSGDGNADVGATNRQDQTERRVNRSVQTREARAAGALEESDQSEVSNRAQEQYGA